MRLTSLILSGLALSAPIPAFAQDAGANAAAYAESVCNDGGYFLLGYISYEYCFGGEFAKYIEWYPQDNGGSEPSPDYDPGVPVVRCTGRIDCKGS
jgi:hypothetical protein